MEKRFRFIRSDNPFEGLDDYSTSEDLGVKNPQIHYPIQLALGLGEIDPKHGLIKKLGYYFERLTQGIYGGRLMGCHQLLDTNGNDHNHVKSLPDVVDDTKYHLRDSKAVSSGESLILHDEQIAKYTHLQLETHNSDIKLPKPQRITFEIFRHGVNNIKSNFKKRPLEELVDTLSLKTRFMVSLPLSIIIAMHQLKCETYSARYGIKEPPNNSRLLSPGLNHMLAYPEETISTFGLDPNDYQIQKLRFPQNITMNGKKISPFPVLHVRDRDRSKWVEMLREKGKELYPHLFKLKFEIDNGNVPAEEEKEELFDEPCPF